jgi:DNA polymerase III subunit gamma/tau
VETAPDRRAAAEMVLIRLCHLAEQPTPGDLVRRLSANPPTAGTAAAAPPPSTPPTSGVRAVAGAAAPAVSVPANAPAQPRLLTFRDVAALVAEHRQAMLHAHLVHSVHLVRFAPPVIELRPKPDAPKDVAPKLMALLAEATGARWTVALSTAQGEPTLAEAGNAADAGRRAAAAEHPLVRAILEAFPGSRIDTVHDTSVDAYGLPEETAPTETPDDQPEFAPPGVELFDDMEPDE